MFGVMLEAQIFTGTCLHPVTVFSSVPQRRRAVSGAVQHIELVGKFMIDNVMAPFGMAASMQRRVPNDNDRALLKGLPNNGMGSFYGRKSSFKKTEFTLWWKHGGWIDYDCFDILIVIVRQAKKKEARLSRDGNADFVGKFQPAASFPILFGDKDLDKLTQMSAFSIVQHAVMGNITVQDIFPCGRKWLLYEFFPATIGKPAKHRDSFYRLISFYEFHKGFQI